MTEILQQTFNGALRLLSGLAVLAGFGLFLVGLSYAVHRWVTRDDWISLLVLVLSCFLVLSYFIGGTRN